MEGKLETQDGCRSSQSKFLLSYYSSTKDLQHSSGQCATQLAMRSHLLTVQRRLQPIWMNISLVYVVAKASLI